MANELTKIEKTELEAYEAEFEKIQPGFMRGGQILGAIRDKRLYRETHKTFETYCKERWSMGKSHAYRLIEASQVAVEAAEVVHANVPHGGQISISVETSSVPTEPVVTTERVARAVSAVPKEDRQEVIEAAAKKGPLTSATVKAAAEEVAKAKEPEPVLDEEGRRVPADLADLFSRSGEVQALSRKTIALRKEIEEIAATPLGAAIDMNDCNAHLKHVQINLTGWKPHAVCPYPGGGKEKSHASCRACGGRRWLTKLQWKAVPLEIREAAK